MRATKRDVSELDKLAEMLPTLRAADDLAKLINNHRRLLAKYHGQQMVDQLINAIRSYRKSAKQMPTGTSGVRHLSCAELFALYRYLRECSPDSPSITTCCTAMRIFIAAHASEKERDLLKTHESMYDLLDQLFRSPYYEPNHPKRSRGRPPEYNQDTDVATFRDWGASGQTKLEYAKNKNPSNPKAVYKSVERGRKHSKKLNQT